MRPRRTFLSSITKRSFSSSTASRDQTGLPLESLAPSLKHVGGEVDRAVPGRLRADERATPGNSLSREDAGELVDDPAILAEEGSDLASPRAAGARGGGGSF